MTGKKLKLWRMRKRYSQSQAAEVLGVSLRSLQNWEQEHRTMLNIFSVYLSNRMKEVDRHD